MTQHRLSLVIAVMAIVGMSSFAWWRLSAGTTRPAACDEMFTTARCELMATYAAEKLGIDRAQVVAVDVLPPPTAEVRDGVTILHMVSGARPVETLVALADGSTHKVSMDCMGIPAIQCQDAPELQAISPTRAGYHDVPCTGEAPAGCASPVAGPDPDARRDAVELFLPFLEIPIDHDGRYEVRVGEARLPNGLLTEASFILASAAWSDDMTIAGGEVRIEVRSLDHPENPFHNAYDHGRIDGVERVEGVLVFDIRRHDPGAILSVRAVVIR